MSNFVFADPYMQLLCQPYTDNEIVEIQKYLEDWSQGTYASAAHSVWDHAKRKSVEPLKYLRQAHSFNKKGAKRVPPKGYRRDGSAVYRKQGQYLIVRLDAESVEKIVSFGTSGD